MREIIVNAAAFIAVSAYFGHTVEMLVAAFLMTIVYVNGRTA